MSACNTIDPAVLAAGSVSGIPSPDLSNCPSTAFAPVDLGTPDPPAVNPPDAVADPRQLIGTVPGQIIPSANPLSMAILGEGLFALSQPVSFVTGLPIFDPQLVYSRLGDFALNGDSGYLVNSAGQYLNGWSVDPATGIANQKVLTPIEVTQTIFSPIMTRNVTIEANLPASPAYGTATIDSPLSSQITVYDALGTAHVVTLNWTQNQNAGDSALTNDWNLQIEVPDAASSVAGAVTSVDAGTARLQFGANSGQAVPEGTIGQISTVATSSASVLTTSGYATGAPATLDFTTDFGLGPQTITLNLGNYGSSYGVTQYAGAHYALLGLTQDGVPLGKFVELTIQNDGLVIANFDNGQTLPIAQIPVVTFNSPDELQSHFGQVFFTATAASGPPVAAAVHDLMSGFIEVLPAVANPPFPTKVMFDTTSLWNPQVTLPVQAPAAAPADASAPPAAPDGSSSGLIILDTTSGLSPLAAAQSYTGPVTGLQQQYINITADGLNVSATTPDWFLHSGSGEDALSVSSGINVLDGGTGSNFLSGGSGTDAFFLDDRAATADIWSTVVNFHAGDTATVWGVTPSGSQLSWADGQGALGYTGLTLTATAAGTPDASLTLAGFRQADMANGRLSVSFGTDPGSGSTYLNIHANS